MLRDAAVSLIQEQLGFRSDLSSNIITHLQFAQTRLESGPTKPWFLLQKDSALTTIDGIQAVALPTDFLQEAEEGVLRFLDADGVELDLTKGTYDVLRKNFKDTDTGVQLEGSPEAYALLNDNLYIFPVPDDAYDLLLDYWKRDTTLDSNVENGWLKWVPGLIMGTAGQVLAGSLRDMNAKAEFQRWESEGRILVHSQNVAREEANLDSQVGGPHA